ncbi:hypothetical protein EDD37DRAFT_133233 [Exophiala viscosa]|uniref:uncharacterized protein n=1 Tax=Exophiala viscosa TaxID=2486360 RepID=UPI002198A206|nr:hypothetical protein EDD37DRAFT_133233 [Exophiala viscosa]
MADQALRTQQSICSQCMSLWRDLISLRQRSLSERYRPGKDRPGKDRPGKCMSLWRALFPVRQRSLSEPFSLWKIVRDHHQSLIELRNSAQHGCPFCSLLWISAAVKTLQRTESLLKVSYSVIVEPSDVSFKVGSMEISAPKEQQVSGGSCRIEIEETPNYNWSNIRHNRKDCSTASEACFNVAKRWLTDCTTTHMPCSLAGNLRKLERGQFTPRRLLKLFTDGDKTCLQLLSDAKAIGFCV